MVFSGHTAELLSALKKHTLSLIGGFLLGFPQALTQKWIAVILWRIKSLFDRPRGYPAEQIDH